MTYLVRGMSKEDVAKKQSEKNCAGREWEDRLLSLTSNPGWERVNYSLDWAPDVEIIKKWIIDLVHHGEKIWVEAATSPKQEKVSNIRMEAQAYKNKYPDYKFVVAVKAFPTQRKSDGMSSMYDQLLEVKDKGLGIDHIVVGEDEVIKFMDKPLFDKVQRFAKPEPFYRNYNKTGEEVVHHDWW